MKVAIVLGNRLNDDGSLSAKGIKRCEIAKKALKIFEFEKIILTGGIANDKANISEAKAMYEYLKKDINEDMMILEEEAMSTDDNALNSLKIARELKADEVVVISSIEHFGRSEPKNAIMCFRDAIKQYPEIQLSMYTEEY